MKLAAALLASTQATHSILPHAGTHGGCTTHIYGTADQQNNCAAEGAACNPEKKGRGKDVGFSWTIETDRLLQATSNIYGATFKAILSPPGHIGNDFLTLKIGARCCYILKAQIKIATDKKGDWPSVKNGDSYLGFLRFDAARCPMDLLDTMEQDFESVVQVGDVGHNSMVTESATLVRDPKEGKGRDALMVQFRKVASAEGDLVAKKKDQDRFFVTLAFEGYAIWTREENREAVKSCFESMYLWIAEDDAKQEDFEDYTKCVMYEKIFKKKANWDPKPMIVTTLPPTTHDWTTHNLTTHDFTTPNMTTHDWTTPNMTTHDWTTHEWTSPNMTTHDFTTPNMTTHDWTTPTMPITPNITTHDWTHTTPNITTHSWTSPNITTPTMPTTPDLTTHEWTSPNMTSHTWTSPNITSHTWTHTTPNITSPTMPTTPEITTHSWSHTSPNMTTHEWTSPNQGVFEQLVDKIQDRPAVQHCTSFTGSRIVGGSVTRPEDYPWSVRLNDYDDNVCGGTIIADRWILTAAHCCLVKKTQAVLDTIDVHIGDFRGWENGDDVGEIKLESSGIYPHPEYPGNDGYSNDICLIKVPRISRNVKNKTNWAMACLPTEDAKHGDACHVSGWGKNKFNGEVQNERKEVAVNVMQSHYCNNKAYTAADFDGIQPNKEICAGVPSPTGGLVLPGSDSCGGDSGGPLTCVNDGKAYVTGVVAWGDGCGAAGKPGVYANVYNYLSWIASETKKQKPEIYISGAV